MGKKEKKKKAILLKQQIESIHVDDKEQKLTRIEGSRVDGRGIDGRTLSAVRLGGIHSGGRRCDVARQATERGVEKTVPAERRVLI